MREPPKRFEEDLVIEERDFSSSITPNDLLRSIPIQISVVRWNYPTYMVKAYSFVILQFSQFLDMQLWVVSYY